MSEQKQTAFKCPCGLLVDSAFYPQHIESGHKLHVITIAGIDPMISISGNNPQKQKGWLDCMMDLPYGGRITRRFFFIWSVSMIIIGVMLGARII